MDSFLNQLLEQSSGIPVLSAFILGLLTAISPCPLATNITAVGYLGKDLNQKKLVFINGLVYTSGRIFSYTALAAIVVLGANQLKLLGFFQMYGEKVIGPLLLFFGLIMLGIFPSLFTRGGVREKRFLTKTTYRWLDVFLLGVLFALAFCPYSGVLYFGVLLPLTLKSGAGLLLPVFFAIATGLPVILFTWLLAYTVSGVGKWYNRIRFFEKWFRRVIALVFIGVGIYYIMVVYVI